MSAPTPTDGTRRRMPRIVTGRGLITIGLLSSVLGGIGFSDDIDFLRRAERVTATVVETESRDDATFPVGTATLTYAVDGVGYRETAPPSFHVPETGATIEAAYDPQDPRDVRLMHPGDHWLLPAWAVLFGLVTFGFGVDRLRAERRRDRDPLDDVGSQN